MNNSNWHSMSLKEKHVELWCSCEANRFCDNRKSKIFIESTLIK